MKLNNNSKNKRPNIAIGMFLYNEEKHVGEALDSLLSQTYKKFKMIIVNDSSTDNTKKIVTEFVRNDKRIHYFENNQRMGYAENYRRCFRLAVKLSGNKLNYLAWAAGHDKYHPNWLSEMVRILDKYPEVVMVYPLTVRISDSGKVLSLQSPQFETFGFSLAERVLLVCNKGIGFGNMIYGLFRANKLRSFDIFPSLLVPDLVLLIRLSFSGTYYQVKKKLWYRRYVDLFSIERQKRTVFSKPPFYSHIPWPIINTIYLFWKTCLFPPSQTKKNRKLGLILCLFFLKRYYSLFQYHYPKYGKYLMLPYIFIYQIINNLNEINKKKVL